MIRTEAELTALQIPKWFFPSFHGDIRLMATGDDTCDLVLTKLTTQEEKAIVALAAIAKKKGWSDSLVPSSPTVSLRAPIAKVAKSLEKLLKPERTSITAVLFADGAMAEVRGPVELTRPALAGAEPEPTIEKSGWEKAGRREEPVDAEILPSATKTAKAAATVAAPIRGCPAPDFTKADLRAKEVLRVFLSPDQVRDFDRYNKFVSVGQTTGNHYMITSRHARDELTKYTRTLFDLDRRMPLCVHDWDVPAAEEMLTLHVLLQLPGWERYLDVSENNMERVLEAFLEEDPYLPVVHGPFAHAGLTMQTRPMTVSPAVRDAMRRGLI